MNSKLKKTKASLEKELEENLVLYIEQMLFYKIKKYPKTIFVSYGLEDSDLPEEVIQLRNHFGYMLQTEIQ